MELLDSYDAGFVIVTQGPIDEALAYKKLVDSEDGFTFAGDVGDGLAAISMAKQQRPDVILMGIRMPGIDGLETTRRLMNDPELHHTKVIMLTTFDHDQYVVDGGAVLSPRQHGH